MLGQVGPWSTCRNRTVSAQQPTARTRHAPLSRCLLCIRSKRGAVSTAQMAVQEQLTFGLKYEQPPLATEHSHLSGGHTRMPAPNSCLIGAPWLVNGGHGASLKQAVQPFGSPPWPPPHSSPPAPHAPQSKPSPPVLPTPPSPPPSAASGSGVGSSYQDEDQKRLCESTEPSLRRWQTLSLRRELELVARQR
jgi:hypothetical protein